MEDTQVHKAACHCGTVQFEVRLADESNTIRRCTCSYCRMRGAIAVTADLSGIKFISGQENMTHSKFNTNMAKHYLYRTSGT